MKRIAGGLIAVLVAAGCGSSSGGGGAKATPTTEKKPASYCEAIPAFQKAAAAAQHSDPDKLVEEAAAWDDVVAVAPDTVKADAQQVGDTLHSIANATKNAGLIRRISSTRSMRSRSSRSREERGQARSNRDKDAMQNRLRGQSQLSR